MKKASLFFTIYQWVIAFPVLLVLTILTAVFTIVLSPLLPNSQISYFPARWWGRLFCYLLFVKVRLVGIDKLNPKQSYVIACNHQSMYDIFVIYGWLPMYFKWMMKAELRKIPLVGKACAAAGHIFINRSNAIAAKHCIEKAEAQLQNGVSVVIFPEGTRTYNGEMGPFKRGAFRIATDLSLPIVPVTLRGCFEVMPRNSFRITPGIIEVIVHDPIDVNTYLPDNAQGLMNKTWQDIHAGL
ncbi:MAG: phospholipid/glycerol acyltransferase [Bacteroidetes bacterium]|nr:phospholipid/glycerol acyltransferase [Bacteroidota bacterium]